MSLNWDLRSIVNHKTVCWVEDDRMNPITEILIFATLTVGLEAITSKNLTEWEIRLAMLHRAGLSLGSRLDEETGDREPWTPGREELLAHIGLKTNASPSISRAKFRTRLAKMIEDDVERELRRAKDAAA